MPSFNRENSPNIFKRTLTKPDKRYLHLYSWNPISENIAAQNPHHDEIKEGSHLRWHPLREEWVAFASHRQHRTFLPPPEYNPLAPTSSIDFPTEMPSGDYDVAVFENLFPSLSKKAKSHFPPPLYIPTAPGDGVCEVVVFTKNPLASLGKLTLDRIELILHVWIERYRELQTKSEIKYILPFENRGVEMGVTLHHPHGQIYAYPTIPPIQQQMVKSQRDFFRKHNLTLLTDILKNEINDEKRIIYQNDSMVSFIPAFARYPYETWLAPKIARQNLTDFTNSEIKDLARALKTTILKFDNLWQKPFPYLMALFAAPSDGEKHPEWHFHIEFYPPLRSEDKIKYLAGTELAAGFFINDCLPEESANELRQVKIHEVF